MENTFLLISALNLLLSLGTYLLVLHVKLSVIDKHVIKNDEKNVPEKAQTKPEISKEEKQRIEREAKRKAEQWNNFFSYTGESQMKGGD